MFPEYKLRGVVLAYRLAAATLFTSYRVRWQGPGAEPVRRYLAGGEPFVAAFWHYSVVLWPWFCHRAGGRWAAMVSASEDGALVAAVLEAMGVATVRGSRNRAGASALKGFVRLMGEGVSAAIVADGSQGPARQAQPGALLLAAHGRCPLVPMNWAADRYWTFNSWDRTVLPKPWARVVVHFGEPLAVPGAGDRAGLAAAHQRLQEGLDRSYRLAWEAVGMPGHAAGA